MMFCMPISTRSVCGLETDYSDSFTELKGKTGCAKGIAVENALEPVKDIASEICESNEDDGVAKWIKENLL